jgi:serine/threonine-protein kinase
MAILGGVFSPRVAGAQSAEDKAAAEAAFEEGKRLMTAHAFAEACPKFAESLRRGPGIGAMLGLADCYEQNGQTASAWAQFRDAAAVAARKGDKREALARDNAARLETRLSKILVRVPPEADAQGLVVKRDGVEIGRALWDEAVPVDPGVHAISASAPGLKEWQTTIEAPRTPGVQTVTVPRLEPAPAPEPPLAPQAAPAPGPPTPASPPPDPGRTQRIVAGAAAGVGVVGIAVGSVLGLVAKSKLDQSNSNGNCDPTDACNGTGLALRQNAESAALGSTVAFVIGGVAVAGGAVLWFTAPHAESTRVGIAPGPRGLALVGRW